MDKYGFPSEAEHKAWKAEYFMNEQQAAKAPYETWRNGRIGSYSNHSSGTASDIGKISESNWTKKMIEEMMRVPLIPPEVVDQIMGNIAKRQQIGLLD